MRSSGGGRAFVCMTSTQHLIRQIIMRWSCGNCPVWRGVWPLVSVAGAVYVLRWDLCVLEAAQLYSKSQKWVSNQVKTYENQTRLRLADLIAHRGDPPGTGTSPSESLSEKSQKVAPEVA